MYKQLLLLLRKCSKQLLLTSEVTGVGVDLEIAVFWILFLEVTLGLLALGPLPLVGLALLVEAQVFSPKLNDVPSLQSFSLSSSGLWLALGSNCLSRRKSRCLSKSLLFRFRLYIRAFNDKNVNKRCLDTYFDSSKKKIHQKCDWQPSTFVFRLQTGIR